jgi:hypothetical protein
MSHRKASAAAKASPMVFPLVSSCMASEIAHGTTARSDAGHSRPQRPGNAMAPLSSAGAAATALIDPSVA